MFDPTTEDVTVRVTQTNPAPGTLRWLLAQDLTIDVVSASGDARDVLRAAALTGPHGVRLLPLAVTDPLGRTRRVTREEASEHVAWTDAAWVVLSRVAEHAETLLREPAWMAEAVSVRFEPVSPVADGLLADSGVDPGVRGVLYDFLVERGRLPDAPAPSPDTDWEVPF